MCGFQGRAHIDLTKKTHNWLSLEESLCERLGGLVLVLACCTILPLKG
jgi:hypothetical protein